MTESKKIKAVYKDIPNRKEVKSILKTGKGLSGEEVHATSRQLLRTARLIDLESFGDEVNKANKNLNDKMDQIIANTDKAISEDRTNFYAFMSFLIEKKVLPETAMEDYFKFKSEFIDAMNKSGEFLQKKEEEIKKQAAEMIAKANAEGKTVEEKKIIIP